MTQSINGWYNLFISWLVYPLLIWHMYYIRLIFVETLLVSALLDEWVNLCSFSFIHFFINGARRYWCNIGIAFVSLSLHAQIYMHSLIRIFYCLSWFIRRVIFVILRVVFQKNFRKGRASEDLGVSAEKSLANQNIFLI